MKLNLGSLLVGVEPADICMESWVIYLSVCSQTKRKSLTIILDKKLTEESILEQIKDDALREFIVRNKLLEEVHIERLELQHSIVHHSWVGNTLFNISIQNNNE